MYNHEMIFLNPNYKGEGTPVNYRDWLDLIYESIHNPTQPTINLGNLGIKRASELVNTNNIDPYEWEESKLEVTKKKVLVEEREEGKDEGIEIGKVEGIEIGLKLVAIKAIKKGMDNESIKDLTGLTDNQIIQLRTENKNETNE